MPSPNNLSEHVTGNHQLPPQNEPSRSQRDTNTCYLFCPHCGQVMAETGREVRCRRCGFQCCPTCGDA